MYRPVNLQLQTNNANCCHDRVACLMPIGMTVIGSAREVLAEYEDGKHLWLTC